MTRKRNVAASIRARLLDLSRARGEAFDYVLNRYAIERLLNRLSCSSARDRFVLNCSVFPVPVMALARIDGEPLSRLWATFSDAQRFDALAAVADELSRLHAIGPDRVLDAGFSSPWWRERVARIERLLLELRPTPGFPGEWLDHMARYLDEHRHALTTAPPPGVLHNDVNLGNVLIADRKVAALLDFDDALAGPPEEDWWQLLFRGIEAEPPLSLEQIRDLPWFDLGAAGTLERFNIGEIQNVLDLLSGRLSWVDAETALADGRETYTEAFLGDRHARILDRLT